MGSDKRESDCASGDPYDGVIISFLDGFVWLSWMGSESKVKVGRYDPVVAAMRDFLAQCELGERLINKKG